MIQPFFLNSYTTITALSIYIRLQNPLVLEERAQYFSFELFLNMYTALQPLFQGGNDDTYNKDSLVPASLRNGRVLKDTTALQRGKPRKIQ